MSQQKQDSTLQTLPNKPIIFLRKPQRKVIGLPTTRPRPGLFQPMTRQQMLTQRVYIKKCKTQAIDRTLEDDKFLLSQDYGRFQVVNEFISTEDEPKVNLSSMVKIKRQMNVLDKIQRKMERYKEKDGRSSDCELAKSVKEGVVSERLLPPIQISKKHSRIEKRMCIDKQKTIQCFDGMITFSPYKKRTAKKEG